MGLEKLVTDGILTTTVEKMVKLGAALLALGPHVRLACCAIEMMATSASRYDLARFGAEVFARPPRQRTS